MGSEEEQNRELVLEFTEAWNEPDFERLGETITDDYVVHDDIFFQPEPGLEGTREMIEDFRTAFSDGTFEIQQMVVEGNQVCVRWIATGTHDGELYGVPPTGKEFEFEGFELERIDGGLVAETWTVYDAFGLLQQLEVLPDLPALD